MSPQQTAQIRLRLDRVAQERTEQAAAMVEAKPVPVKARLVTQPGKPVKTVPNADASLPLVTDKPAGNGRNAQKQATYRNRKGEAGKQADAARKRASRAKGAK